MPIQYSFLDSPVGIIEIKSSDTHILSVLFNHTLNSNEQKNKIPEIKKNEHPLLLQCETQLKEYFDGQRILFDLPLQQDGTDFQQKVWAQLLLIPFGKTISYLELSKRIGNVKAIRAVGTTNGNNSISIIVPCHRVIGSNGDLTGYSGELWRKKWLLGHEAKYAHGVQTLF
jgi:methylated-DNA-[protein]-cysteine S-methyltransferase